MSELNQPLPVKGYVPQDATNIMLVNSNKELEEQMLRVIDALFERGDIDKRWLAIGRTHIEEGFMAINRSIFKPQRVKFTGEDKDE